MDVKLLWKTRLDRILRLSAPSGVYTVKYNGYGIGSESVHVNGTVVARERSWVKMIPRFEFPIGPHAGVIRIETKLWRDLLGPFVGRLESFILEVDGEVVYEDSILSKKRLTIGRLVMWAVVVFVVLIALFMLSGGIAREVAISRRMRCEKILHGLGEAILVYASDNEGRYPTADKWCDLLVQGGYATQKQFKCPGDKQGPCSYAMNPYCEPNSPNDTILLFQAIGGWNQYGGPELWGYEHHHFKRSGHVLLKDGWVNLERPEWIDKSKWKGEGKE